MRYAEILGIRVNITSDESYIIDLITHTTDGKYPVSELDEYNELVAERMVSRGIINSLTKEDGSVFITLNTLPDYVTRI